MWTENVMSTESDMSTKNDMSTVLDVSTENVDNVGYIETNGMSTGMICRQYSICRQK